MTHGSLESLGLAPVSAAPSVAHAGPLPAMRRSATGDLVLSDHLPLNTQHLAHTARLHHAAGQGGDTGAGGLGAGGLPPRPHGGGRGSGVAPLTPAVYSAGAAGMGTGAGGMGHGMGSGTGQQWQGAGPQVAAVLYTPAHAAAGGVAGGVGVGGLGSGQAGGTGLPLPAAERQALEAQHTAARHRVRQRSYGQLQGLDAAPAAAGGQQQQPQQQGQHGVPVPLPHVRTEQQQPQRPAVQQPTSHHQQQQQLPRRGATPPAGGPGAGLQAIHAGLPAGAGPGHGQGQGQGTVPAVAAAHPGAGAGPAQGRAAGAGPTIANHLVVAGAGAVEAEGPGAGVCITGIKQRLMAYLYGTCLRAHPGHPRRQQREALVLFRHMDLYRSLVIRKVGVMLLLGACPPHRTLRSAFGAAGATRKGGSVAPQKQYKKMKYMAAFCQQHFVTRSSHAQAQLVDRHRLLLELRTPAAADVASSTPGAPAGPPPAPGPGVPPCQFYALYDMASTRVITMRASECRLG